MNLKNIDKIERIVRSIQDCRRAIHDIDGILNNKRHNQVFALYALFDYCEKRDVDVPTEDAKAFLVSFRAKQEKKIEELKKQLEEL